MSTRGGMIYLTVWVSSSVNCLFMSFEEFLFCVIFSLLLIGFLGICCKLEEGLHLSGLILQSDEMSLQLTLLISLPILFVSLEWIISFWNEKYKAMAPHSSTLAWKIPWTEEPGRLQSTGSLRVGHDWATSLSLFTFHSHALEKEMATHSSVLAWRIPGMAEPGGLPSMGSHRVRHDWSDLAAAAASILCAVLCESLFWWRRKCRTCAQICSMPCSKNPVLVGEPWIYPAVPGTDG